jgi:hypothetical protein
VIVGELAEVVAVDLDGGVALRDLIFEAGRRGEAAETLIRGVGNPIRETFVREAVDDEAPRRLDLLLLEVADVEAGDGNGRAGLPDVALDVAVAVVCDLLTGGDGLQAPGQMEGELVVGEVAEDLMAGWVPGGARAVHEIVDAFAFVLHGIRAGVLDEEANWLAGRCAVRELDGEVRVALLVFLDEVKWSAGFVVDAGDAQRGEEIEMHDAETGAIDDERNSVGAGELAGFFEGDVDGLVGDVRGQSDGVSAGHLVGGPSVEVVGVPGGELNLIAVGVEGAFGVDDEKKILAGEKATRAE